MPRDLQQSDRNEMIIQDAISACQLTLFYRQPSTAERIAFQRAAWVRNKKNKLTNNSPAARAEYGALVLTGIGEKDFTCGKDADGQYIFISSDPASPDYRDDWKNQVIATAGDLLMLLGMQVFEGSLKELVKAAAVAQVDTDEDEDDEDTEEGQDVGPLESNSNG